MLTFLIGELYIGNKWKSGQFSVNNLFRKFGRSSKAPINMTFFISGRGCSLNIYRASCPRDQGHTIIFRMDQVTDKIGFYFRYQTVVIACSEYHFPGCRLNDRRTCMKKKNS